MSLEVLEQLEAKVQTAVDNIALLKMEKDELQAESLSSSRKTSNCATTIRHGRSACVPCSARWIRWKAPSKCKKPVDDRLFTL